VNAALPGNALMLMANAAVNLSMSVASVVATVLLSTCKVPAVQSLMQMESAVLVDSSTNVAYVTVSEILARYN
jgi:hypothetical protein